MAGSVKFGLAFGGFSAGVPGARELSALAQGAESAGFDAIHVGDHIQWHAPIFETTVLMATFAAMTTTLRIAADIILLPLRDPVLIAKTVASLDVLSGGRVIFGVGVGGEHPPEFAAMRVPLSERGGRANEGLAIVRGLFAHERFSYSGRHYTIRDVALAPRPVQEHLPIWVGGSSDAALRRAARHADGWVAAFSSERKFARLAETLRGFRAEEGRTSPDFTWGAYLFVNVGPQAEARAGGAEFLSRVYGLDGASIMDRYGAAGPVETCAERVQAYVEAGVDYVVLAPACGYRDWPRQMEGLGELAARFGAPRR